ncbi:class I adenylate-forming enzyme family protein [Streptomyces sp. NPDC055078]
MNPLTTAPAAGPGDTDVTRGADLTWPLRRAARLYGGRESVVDRGSRYTYAQFLERCERIAALLGWYGAAPGDRIAVLGANSADYLAAYFAVPASRCVLVPLNARLADAELAAVTADCAPVLLIADRAHAPRAAQVAAAAGARWVTMDQLLGEESGGDGECGGVPRTTPPAGRAPGPHSGPRPDDLAAIFYTGGSTGRAKGAMLTHRGLAANALHLALGLGYRDDDVYLHCAPMFHLGDGMSVHPVTWAGGRHVIVPRFDPADVLRAIEDERVTCTFLVPTMLTLLLEHLDGLDRLDSHDRAPDLSSVRLVVHGGAPIAPALLRRAVERLGCSFTQSYGMTEAGPILSLLPGEEKLLGRPELLSAGRPVAGVEVRVVRPDGTECAVGETGEITGRGPNFALGYWNQPEITQERFRDGWYWTGDLAHRDDGGRLYIVGRAGDVIISGGENVYAAEVEAALAAHSDVVEAAVFAVPSPQWGEQVHAAVVLRGTAPATADALDAHCRARIAGYKIPRSYEFHAVLPRTGPGKIDKLALRAPHWAGREREVS